jgi:hypothetical protein
MRASLMSIEGKMKGELRTGSKDIRITVKSYTKISLPFQVKTKAKVSLTTKL